MLPFGDISVNTKTLVCSLNVQFDLVKLYESLEPTADPPLSKKRKRLSAGLPVVAEPQREINAGDIVSVKLETRSQERYKGYIIGGKVDSKPFRNSVAVDIFVGNAKRINVKISSNGCLQLTGGQCRAHGLEAVRLLLSKIEKGSGVYELTDKRYPDDETVTVHIISVMRNISFSLGFCISRETLGKLLNEHADYQALWAPQYSYAGLNAKRWLPYGRRSVKLFHLDAGAWRFERDVSVDDYLQLQERTKGPGASRKMKNDIVMTFLVFQSGKVIFSGLNSKTMRGPYKDFIDLVNASRESVEEVIVRPVPVPVPATAPPV